MEFSEWLLNELKKRNWTQSDLANAAGVNRQVISSYINSKRKNPNIRVLSAIAKGLNVPLGIVVSAAYGLEPDCETNEITERLVYYASKMSEDKQKILMSIAEKLSEDETQKKEQESRGKSPAQSILEKS